MTQKNKPVDSILKKSVQDKEIKEYFYDYVKGLDLEKIKDKELIDYLLKSFKSTGFQATDLARAVEISEKIYKDKEKLKDNMTIFMGFTSNIISSGLRDIIKYYCKNKKIDVIVTTAGGIEEDIIKCLKPFIVSKDWYNSKEDNKKFREKGINRIGNILVPNNRYCDYEDFISFALKNIMNYDIVKKDNGVMKNSDFIMYLIKELEKYLNGNEIIKESYLYWCYKNNIKVYCPALIDGSTGDMIFIYKKNYPGLRLDNVDDMVEINKIAVASDKTAVIIIGGALPKHHIINANLMREGTDYAIYFNNANYWDGSVSGAKPEEGLSWGKIEKRADFVEVFGDASINFTLFSLGMKK